MGNVKERPILFSTDMVRAVLDGRKVQTRRVVKPRPPSIEAVRAASGSDYGWLQCGVNGDRYASPDNFRVTGPVWAVRDLGGPTVIRCPFGQPGDRLWVREAWALSTDNAGYACVVHQADGKAREMLCDNEGEGDPCGLGAPTIAAPPARWRPSIHMPRWASRITLEITAVRVERVQDISEEDAEAEGVYSTIVNASPPLHVETRWVAPGVQMTNLYGEKDSHAPAHRTACKAFACLWDSLYATKDGDGWDTNPWVWVVEFKRVEASPTLRRVWRAVRYGGV